MTSLRAVTVVEPDYWSTGIVKFSRAKCFHVFEIVSRLDVGVMFIALP